MKKIVLTYLLIWWTIASFAQFTQFTINGKITDSHTDIPIKNVAITIKQTPASVQTDERGHFSLLSFEDIESRSNSRNNQ